MRTFIVLAYYIHGKQECQTLMVYFGGTLRFQKSTNNFEFVY